MKIPVYILSSSNPNHRDELTCFFNKNKLFKVIELCCGDLPAPGINFIDSETNLVLAALADASKNYPCNYCLIIKDSSVTVSTPKKVAQIIKKAISFNKKSSCNSNSKSCNKSNYFNSSESFSENYTESETYTRSSSCSDSSGYGECCESSDDYCKDKFCKWDIFYLCKWLDRCDLYKTCARSKGTTLVKTESPLGDQALLFSPLGRDMVLGIKPLRSVYHCGKKCDEKCEFFTPITLPLGEQLNFAIEEGNIKALASSPNLFEFDVKLAKFNIDLLKLSECRLPDQEVEEEDENLPGAIPLIWFLIVVGGIILLAWIFYQGIAKYEVVDNTKDIVKLQKR